tara:strand:+ start:2045 stop:2326 length:282 start_codon:yes stop_codon:yes gene_type:complete
MKDFIEFLDENIEEENIELNAKGAIGPEVGKDDEDHEGEMARIQLKKLKDYSGSLFDMLKNDDQLKAWVQSKITKAAADIGSVKHYMSYKEEE